MNRTIAIIAKNLGSSDVSRKVGGVSNRCRMHLAPERLQGVIKLCKYSGGSQ